MSYKGCHGIKLSKNHFKITLIFNSWIVHLLFPYQLFFSNISFKVLCYLRLTNLYIITFFSIIIFHLFNYKFKSLWMILNSFYSNKKIIKDLSNNSNTTWLSFNKQHICDAPIYTHLNKYYNCCTPGLKNIG